jgi:hypothetical protein
MSLTVEQRTNMDGWPKAGELIEMSGTHPLEASDRAILNILYQHAHDSGRMTELGAEWEIPLTKLRFTGHQSNDKLLGSLQRLRRVEVTLCYYAPGKGNREPEERILLTGLFDFFDISARELERRATLRFGLPNKLAPLLARSGRWGRIKAEVVCAMTSKYAIALCEAISLRANMDRCVETFPVDRFRELLGVPPGAYENGTNFMNKVITPALLEVNGLSEFGAAIQLNRRHLRAPIEGVTMTWWRKQGDEFREAIRERNRSKTGRMARLKGNQQVEPPRLALPTRVGA